MLQLQSTAVLIVENLKILHYFQMFTLQDLHVLANDSFRPNNWILIIPDLDFLFHMFFLARYCKLLEENSFRGRTADFFYMLLFGATVLTGIVLLGGMIPYVSESFAKIIFLSNSLTFMMVSIPPFSD